MKLFFSVGEPSGDLHGANLIGELRRLAPDTQFVGYGGPRMAKAGCQLHEDLTQLAVMWFLRAILNIHRFWNLVGRADRYFRHEKPDAVILIDYPGFNWWIARRARVHRIPVFYYGAPQMWAWASWRVGKMRRLVDHVLCKLPFEADWYQQRGCRATYVGHPYFDELSQYQPDQSFIESHTADNPLVTILPGSRSQEVQPNLHRFLKTVRLVSERRPNTRFAVASFNDKQAELAREMINSEGLPVSVHVGQTPELIQLADVCVACSGSVSLELLFHAKPAAILYQISPLAFRVQQWFRQVRYITLVNLLASKNPYCTKAELYNPEFEDVPLPEYLTSEDRSATIADHVSKWLSDPEARRKTVDQLCDLRRKYAVPGATQRAAEYIMAHQKVRHTGSRRVHYVPPRAA
jgi:lipid-A-disaccharide synthase